MEALGYYVTDKLPPGMRSWILPLAPIAVSVIALTITRALRTKENEAPRLTDVIPYVSNTYQYMTDKTTFLARASQALSKSPTVQFHLGPMSVYLITGARNVQALFRASSPLSSDKFMLIIFEHIQGWPREDLARFVDDRSGRVKTPAPGSEDLPAERRVWHAVHHLFGEYLSRAHHTNVLAASFERFFGARLEQFPPVSGSEKEGGDEWAEVRVAEFMRRHVAEAAAQSLLGERILEVCPDYIDAMWEFDLIAERLAFGLPRWLNPRPWRVRERYHGMTRAWFAAAEREFDWDGPDVEADFEPVLGSRFTREVAKWGRGIGMSSGSIGSFLSMQVFGINGNSVAIATWAVLEMIKDPALFAALRAEALASYTTTTDPATGRKEQRRTLDAQRLVAMPLMQSVFTEALRLHVSINVTREVMRPTTLPDGGYALPAGALVQAPSQISQYSEAAWGAPGHPASEFWAARHLRTVERTDEAGNIVQVQEFTTAGSNGHFYPFGGGVSMCPGRFFAKQEVLMVLATIAARFDVEFVEWTMLDGSSSDRPAQNDPRYACAAAVPPDRDMKVRWKRLW